MFIYASIISRLPNYVNSHPPSFVNCYMNVNSAFGQPSNARRSIFFILSDRITVLRFLQLKKHLKGILSSLFQKTIASSSQHLKASGLTPFTLEGIIIFFNPLSANAEPLIISTFEKSKYESDVHSAKQRNAISVSFE